MNPNTQPLPCILGYNLNDLSKLLKEQHGQPAYRVKQTVEWIYKHRASSIDEMLNLPINLRKNLKQSFRYNSVELIKAQGSEDSTRKFLFKLHDGRYIETVLIPASPALYGERSDRHTACVSSQVGCAFGCKFCASGLEGLTRNLTADEIVGQLMQVEAITDKKINNIVFMGMGEPLANIKNLYQALDIITSEWGMKIGARHITISTSGLAPMIKKLADHSQQIRLAISLHGATNETRNKIMPVNQKWPIEELFQALRYYKGKTKKRITLEYILIKNVNDDLEEAKILAKLAKSVGALVNLIPYNKVDGLEWERPSEEHCNKFRDIIRNKNVTTTLRIEKGHDIDAACGQLRLKQESAMRSSGSIINPNLS